MKEIIYNRLINMPDGLSEEQKQKTIAHVAEFASAEIGREIYKSGICDVKNIRGLPIGAEMLEIKAYVATKQKAKLYVNAESTIKSLEDRNAELERRLKTHRRQYNALIDRFDVIGKNIESLAKSIILNSSKKREIISYCKMLHNPHTSPFKSK